MSSSGEQYFTSQHIVTGLPLAACLTQAMCGETGRTAAPDSDVLSLELRVLHELFQTSVSLSVKWGQPHPSCEEYLRTQISIFYMSGLPRQVCCLFCVLRSTKLPFMAWSSGRVGSG